MSNDHQSFAFSAEPAGAPAPAAAPVVVVRIPGLRSVGQAEVTTAVGGPQAFTQFPVDVVFDTRRYAAEIEVGHWANAHAEVWRVARHVREQLAGADAPRLIVAGMPEVPLAIAFGAYVEEQWLAEVFDYHDTTGTWQWPERQRTLALESRGLPRERVPTAGPAVLRVELTARVRDDHVAEFAPDGERVADVRIGPRDRDPAPGLVRSPEDVAAVRAEVRAAIAALVENRPGITTIHLFVAAPVSVCVLTGQELRLRNNPPVQTYRHRRSADGESRMTEAIRLTAGGPTRDARPLTDDQRATAARVRQTVWAHAVRDVEQYANRKGRETQPRRWYDALPWAGAFAAVHPFPALPAARRIIPRGVGVSPEPFDREGFGFQEADHEWRVNDAFLVAIAEAFGAGEEARALVRVFLFHEYLHEVHGITKESYRAVGKFPNGLERADYACDLYGILHETDFAADARAELHDDFPAFRQHVAGLIDLVLRSFWLFEEPPPVERWEVRRVRRYLNWYWQQVRVQRAKDATQLAAVLARQPVVEVAGLATHAEGRRHYVSMRHVATRRFDVENTPELAVSMDSERLQRVQFGENVMLADLLRGFRERDHAQLQEFFRRVFADVGGPGAALPAPEHLP